VSNDTVQPAIEVVWPAVDQSEHCDLPRRWRRLDLIEPAAFVSVDDLPTSFTQALADQVCGGEVSSLTQRRPFPEQLLSLLPVDGDAPIGPSWL